MRPRGGSLIVLHDSPEAPARTCLAPRTFRQGAEITTESNGTTSALQQPYENQPSPPRPHRRAAVLCSVASLELPNVAQQRQLRAPKRPGGATRPRAESARPRALRCRPRTDHTRGALRKTIAGFEEGIAANVRTLENLTAPTPAWVMQGRQRLLESLRISSARVPGRPLPGTPGGRDDPQGEPRKPDFLARATVALYFVRNRQSAAGHAGASRCAMKATDREYFLCCIISRSIGFRLLGWWCGQAPTASRNIVDSGVAKALWRFAIIPLRSA